MNCEKRWHRKNTVYKLWGNGALDVHLRYRSINRLAPARLRDSRGRSVPPPSLATSLHAFVDFY